MPTETMPDFKSLPHSDLVLICEAFWQELKLLRKRVEQLEQENQAFKANGAKPKKTSQNSSSPPSKNQKANLKVSQEPTITKKRNFSHQQGGRKLDPNPDYEIELRPQVCGYCGRILATQNEKIEAVYDKIELPTIRTITTRVKRIRCECSHCQKVSQAVIPKGLENNGLFGDSIQSFITHARFSQAIGLHRLSTFCEEILGIKISQGGIVGILKNVATRLEPRIREIQEVIRSSELIKSDETSCRVGRKTFWEWVFVSPKACLHILDGTRSKSVPKRVFTQESLLKQRPKFWVSDLYAGQGFDLAEHWQLCLAHQIRDCQYAIDCGDTIFSSAIQELFRNAIALHQRRSELSNTTWYSYRLRVGTQLRSILLLQPTNPEGRNLLRRYLKVQAALLTFLEYPDVPPTNNESEQRIRWSVIFRKVTNCSRSLWAAELFMAYRSVVNTGAKHGWSAFESLERALRPRAFFSMTLVSS